MSVGEEDPREAAKQELRRPETQRLLRQWMPDGPKGATPAYRRGWELAFETEKHLGSCAVWDSVEAECTCRPPERLPLPTPSGGSSDDTA